MNKDTRKVQTYIPKELASRLAADAKQAKRSISAQLHLIIEDYYRTQDQKQERD